MGQKIREIRELYRRLLLEKWRGRLSIEEAEKLKEAWKKIHPVTKEELIRFGVEGVERYKRFITKVLSKEEALLESSIEKLKELDVAVIPPPELLFVDWERVGIKEEIEAKLRLFEERAGGNVKVMGISSFYLLPSSLHRGAIVLDIFGESGLASLHYTFLHEWMHVLLSVLFPNITPQSREKWVIELTVDTFSIYYAYKKWRVSPLIYLGEDIKREVTEAVEMAFKGIEDRVKGIKKMRDMMERGDPPIIFSASIFERLADGEGKEEMFEEFLAILFQTTKVLQSIV